MKLCKVDVIDGAVSCAVCGVPFVGTFALSESDLAAIGNDLSKVYRPCGTGTGSAGRRARAAGTNLASLPMADAPPTVTASLTDYRQCLHRGEVVRSERCSTCRGNVLVKVFACAVHGQCQLSARVAGVKVCGPDCREHAPLPG